MSTQQRAADFLKAWQEAMAKQLKDGDALKAMLAAMQGFGGAHDATSRPAAAADAGDDAIRDLAKRVGQLERAVAKLAQSTVPVAAKAKKPARAKRRSVSKPVAATKQSAARAKPTLAKGFPAKARPKRKP